MSKKQEDVPLKDQIKPIFKERFIELLGEKEYLKFEQTILTPQRKSFRINLSKEPNPKELVAILQKKGLNLQAVPWSEDAYFLTFDEEERTDLGNLFEHFLGKIYIQEATSMCPPELIDIPENMDSTFSVLDVAAAPGSKTTQLADKMKGKGILVANEVDYSRLGPLKANLERSGFTNVIITNNDGRRIEGSQRFDRVLLDAPCSGSGVIRKSPRTIKTYNPKRLKAMQRLQLQLLKRSFELLKPQGIMTYSTCSLDPEENELCIKKFLEENDNAILLQAKLQGLKISHKVSSFQGEQIPTEITEKTLRIWPQDNDTNGFYVATIQKIK